MLAAQAVGKEAILHAQKMKLIRIKECFATTVERKITKDLSVQNMMLMLV